MKSLILALLFSTFSIIYSMDNDTVLDELIEFFTTKERVYTHNFPVLQSLARMHIRGDLNHNTNDFGKSCTQKIILTEKQFYNLDSKQELIKFVTAEEQVYTSDFPKLQRFAGLNIVENLKPHLLHNTKGFGKSCNEESYLQILNEIEELKVINYDNALEEVKNKELYVRSLYEKSLKSSTSEDDIKKAEAILDDLKKINTILDDIKKLDPKRLEIADFDRFLNKAKNKLSSAKSLYEINENTHTLKTVEKDGKIIYETTSDEFMIFSTLINKITMAAENLKIKGNIEGTAIDKGRKLLLELNSFIHKIENDNYKKYLETVVKDKPKTLTSTMFMIKYVFKLRSRLINEFVAEYDIKMSDIIKKEGN